MPSNWVITNKLSLKKKAVDLIIEKGVVTEVEPGSAENEAEAKEDASNDDEK